MTKKEMVKMAVKAGFLSNMDADYIISPYCSDDMDLYKELKLFAKLISEKEREECAKVCETAKEKIWEYHEENVKNASFNVCINIAKLIRAKGQE